ncbi:MAG: SDR family oxidoreductase [Pseudomonadota bacterium]|nr:SDR family oxidoreductase [Pseudomonadota bacterium]
MADKVLEGRFALITGGSRGLGKEMAIAYARAGAAGIVITAAPGSDETTAEINDELNDVLLAIEKENCKGIALVGDVSNAEDCKRVIEKTIRAFGALNILINNAGKSGRYVHFGDGSLSISDVDPKGFKEVIDTNILGPYLMTHAAFKYLLQAGWGRVINISKRTDSMHRSAITPYGPSKAAMEAATIAWAEAMYGSGVTFNTLSPGGLVDTKFSTGEIDGKGLNPTVIGPMAVWLASENANDTTGCRFVAELWDSSLPLEEAAEGCREPAIFTTPERETPLEKAWRQPNMSV